MLLVLFRNDLCSAEPFPMPDRIVNFSISRRAAAYAPAALLFASVLVSACTSIGSAAPAQILSHRVTVAWHQIGTTMRSPRLPLRFESGEVVRDCKDYLEQRKHAEVAEGVNNRIAMQDYLICDTMAVLAADGGVVERPSNDDFGEQLRDRLDLSSFPSSLHQLALDYPVLADLKAMTVHADGPAVVAESADWFFKLEVVALADVNHDGHPDWIVWLTDEARGGNYRDYAVLVIPDGDQTGRLHAMPVRNTDQPARQR